MANVESGISIMVSENRDWEQISIKKGPKGLKPSFWEDMLNYLVLNSSSATQIYMLYPNQGKILTPNDLKGISSLPEQERLKKIATEAMRMWRAQEVIVSKSF